MRPCVGEDAARWHRGSGCVHGHEDPVEPTSSKIASVAWSFRAWLYRGNDVARGFSSTTQVGNDLFGLLLGHGLVVPGALYSGPR
jgi:hypothetical protein